VEIHAFHKFLIQPTVVTAHDMYKLHYYRFTLNGGLDSTVYCTVGG